MPTPGRFTYDDSALPLIKVTMYGTLTDDEFERYLDTMQPRLQGDTPSVVIIDATHSDPTPGPQRRRQAEWLKQNAEMLQRLTRLTIFVIPSPVMRTVLNAILWVQPMPSPHRICATLAEALDIAKPELEAIKKAQAKR